jgi:PAS domain S-box-containing protein
MLVVDHAGRVVLANTLTESLFGYQEREMLGCPIEDLIPERFRKKHRGHRANFSAAPRVRPMGAKLELFGLRKDGTEFPVEISLSPIETAEGILVASAIRDITERKRSEEARFRQAAILESIEDAIIFKDLDAVIVSWNAAAQRIFGYTESEVLGQPITILIPPELRDEEKKILKRLREGKRIEHYETARITKAGKRVEVSLTIVPIKDSTGKLVGFCKLAHNITERKRAEEALLESEERFRLIANTAPVAIWMGNTEKECVYVNQAWIELTGHSFEAALGSGWMTVMHPDDIVRSAQSYENAFARRDPFEIEFRIRREDGELRWIVDRGVPRYNGDGSFAGYIGSGMDITEKKLAEEARSEMTRKLIEAQEQERARIARELHDDINQRLALLGFGLDQLIENPSETESKVRELRRLTTELSGDVEALSHDLHSSHLQYLGVVAGMNNWCREFGKRQGMQIDYRHNMQARISSEIGLCLFRVLQEALHNAAKHSGAKRVEVQLHDGAGEIHLTVRDPGRGFDAQTVKQGKGLGLTSMRERVRLVNGTITIESKPMGGTTIDVRVPLASEHASEQKSV